MYCDECGKKIIEEAFYPVNALEWVGSVFCCKECMNKFLKEENDGIK